MFLDSNYLKRNKSILPPDSIYPYGQSKKHDHEYYTKKYNESPLRSYRSQDNLLQYQHNHNNHHNNHHNNLGKDHHTRSHSYDRSNNHESHKPRHNSHHSKNNNTIRNRFSHYMDEKSLNDKYSNTGTNFLISSESNSSEPKSDDDYNPTEPPILWTTKSIYTLDKIMEYINNTKLMKPLGYMVRYYINKHKPDDTETRISTVDKINIDKDSLILAYICEIYLRKNRPKTKIMISNKLIYRTIGKIFHEIIDDNFTYNDWVLNFSEVCMINMLSEIIPIGIEKNNNREIIKSSYYVTKYIIKLIKGNNDLLSYMDTLYTHAVSLDITILSNTQISEIMSIMNISRRLFLRIFLLISHHMMRFNSVINTKWSKKMTTIKNMNQFKDLLSDDVMELIIVTTGINVQ